MISPDFIVPNWPAPANVQSLQTTRIFTNSNQGYSLAPYNSLNFGSHVNDNPMHVAQNRQLLSQFLPSEPVWLNQVHGIGVVDAANTSCVPDADASFTTQKNVVCVTMAADCLPVLLCDKAGSLVAAVHAGWRGLCDGVIEETVNRICHLKAIKSVDLMAWLSPAIGPNAFEVGAEVRAQFVEKDKNSVGAFKAQGDKFLANIYLLATQRLNKIGVTDIYGGGHNEDFCTFSDEKHFFSYRRDGETGRMATLIWLA